MFEKFKKYLAKKLVSYMPVGMPSIKVERIPLNIETLRAKVKVYPKSHDDISFDCYKRAVAEQFVEALIPYIDYEVVDPVRDEFAYYSIQYDKSICSKEIYGTLKVVKVRS